MISIKNLSLSLLIIVLINFLTNHWLLNSDFTSESFFIIKTGVKLVLMLAVILIFRRFHIDIITGYKVNFWIILFICIILTYLSFHKVSEELILNQQYVTSETQIWYLSSALSTGAFEEILFRLFIFNSIYTLIYTNTRKHITLKAVLYTSVLFGLIHMLNIFKSNYDIFSILNQVILAIGLGSLFQGLLIRFGNIFLLITLHGLINYLGMYKHYLFSENVNANTTNELYSLLLTILVSCIAVIFSLLLIKKRLETNTS